MKINRGKAIYFAVTRQQINIVNEKENLHPRTNKSRLKSISSMTDKDILKTFKLRTGLSPLKFPKHALTTQILFGKLGIPRNANSTKRT